MTVQQALRSGVPDARLLLAEASGFSQASLIASPEKELPAEAEARFRDFAERRRKGEPVAYIVGHKEFYSLDLAVNPAVLIPRPETELLIELALQREFRNAVDLGTGSGAIALALKKHRSSAKITAVEASAAALAVAQRNAAKHGLQVEFVHGQWLQSLATFDLIVSNPPYVAENDPHLADLGFEPRSALVSGGDGLDAIREICREARAHLNPGGWLLLEHGMGQDAAVRALLEGAGLESIATWPDLAGIPRVSGGKA